MVVFLSCVAVFLMFVLYPIYGSLSRGNIPSMEKSLHSTIVNNIRALPDWLRAWAAVLYLLFLDAVRKPTPRRRASDREGWRR